MPSRGNITSMEGVRRWRLGSNSARTNCSPTARSHPPPSAAPSDASRPSPSPSSLPSPAPRANNTPISPSPGSSADGKHKNAEAIAYRHDRDRQTLQSFLGSSPWDHMPLIDELNRQVAHDLGRPDAVLVFDPSAFPKKGTASGVQRQWCGRLGKLENCQVGVYLGDVTDADHVLIDF